MTRTFIRTVCIASCLLLVVAACSKKVDSGSVEDQVVTNVEKAFKDVDDASADCPGDIKAEKGKSFTCTVKLDGKSTDIGIKITKVDGEKFNFDLNLTQAIIPVSKTEADLEKQLGANSKVDCGTGKVLIKSPDTTITCKATARGQSQDIKLRVTDTKGSLEVAT